MKPRSLILAAALLVGLACRPSSDVPAAIGPATSSPGAERVVLLHGLGRTSRSMGPAERFLRRAGYEVVNLDYPSRTETLEDLADGLTPVLGPLCEGAGPPLHLVTHSMGGILARVYLSRHGCDRLGRVVMLAPPSHGSELADRFGSLAGPAGAQLGTGPDSVPSRLEPVDFELGVIIGSRSWNPIGSAAVPGDDDGAVSIESARVEGMADFLVVPATHSFIMRKRSVLEQVRRFLETGRFEGGADRGRGGGSGNAPAPPSPAGG